MSCLPLIIILTAYIGIKSLLICLSVMNVRYIKKHASQVPPELDGMIDAETLEKSISYTLTSSNFGMKLDVFRQAVKLTFIFSGVMLAYSQWIQTLELGFILSGIVFFGLLAIAESILEIPFDIYDTFKIEKHFGFNRSTPGIWLGDTLKHLVLNLVFQSILLGGALGLIIWLPQWWWLPVWAFFFAFSVFMMYVAPYVLEPLFNKFTPLDDAELERDVTTVLAKAGIKVKGVFKMDASKRSSHTNAYFTGIGREKRIVLYDTLLEKLDHDEIIAVLAHEAGHCRKKHIIKLLTIFELSALAGAYAAFLLLGGELLPRLFCMNTDDFFVKLILFAFLGKIATWIIHPCCNILSRRFEREADAFAREITGDGDSLASALAKLTRDNLSNLFPHPLYAWLFYSHPPALERIRRLKTKKS
jgi:STE24 endopeptidase